MADYKHWILMGSLMGMALANDQLSAARDDRYDISRMGESHDDNLDDRGLYNENQMILRDQQGQVIPPHGEGGGCKNCKHGPIKGPAQLLDDGV